MRRGICFSIAIDNDELACPFPHLSFQGEAYFAYFAGGIIDPLLKVHGLASSRSQTAGFRINWIGSRAGAQTTSGSAMAKRKTARIVPDLVADVRNASKFEECLHVRQLSG